jgi:thioesterase domain-containing protein
VTAEELRAYLYQNIPLARALAVEVLVVGEGCVELGAPLAPNRNHRHTAFGGSVAAVAILAGWGWLRARLAPRAPELELVIQRQEMEFLRPIDADFTARCAAPAATAWQRFERALVARDRARLELAVEVRCRGRVGATFRGAYVALAGRASAE